jgi:para-aminobenzoate synthetase component 1
MEDRMRPRVEEIETKLSAYDAFRRFHDRPSVAFLESLPGYGGLGRHSILGLNPYATLRGWTDRCEVNGRVVAEDPLTALDRLLREHQTEPMDDLPLSGGCIGSIAYDFGHGLVEPPLPRRFPNSGDLRSPLVRFDFYDDFLVFDHETGKVTAIACGRLQPTEESIAVWKRELARTVSPVIHEGREADIAKHPNIRVRSEAAHMQKVERIREHIRQGDVYIVNLTDQLRACTDLAADVLYDRLRRINPAPFAAFVRQDDVEILSASPERLLRIGPRQEEGLRIETRPIKGTRPRGKDASEDARYAKELLESEKDKSELLMIVDLERNDISRLCRPESVEVPELFRLETFPSVFHLVATVTGILREGVSVPDCLRTCFPGGSISGAPKRAAMEIIDRLEDETRGLYTGCLGYLSLDGRADLSILIRTLVKQGDFVRYGSGGGITWESDAREEYRELLTKAESFRKVLEGEEA